MIIVQGSLIRISCFLMYKAFKFTFIMMVTLPCPSVVGNGRAENNSTLLQFEVSDIKSERMRSMEINKTASKTIPESHRYYKTSDMISVPIFSCLSNPRARVLRGRSDVPLSVGTAHSRNSLFLPSGSTWFARKRRPIPTAHF